MNYQDFISNNSNINSNVNDENKKLINELNRYKKENEEMKNKINILSDENMKLKNVKEPQRWKKKLFFSIENCLKWIIIISL